jgi:hypothetical protein
MLPCTASLDLNGPKPVARKILAAVPKSANPITKYLVQTPAGEILQVWRWRKYQDSLTRVELPPDFVDDDEVGDDQELARVCILSWVQWLNVPSG